MTPDELGRLKAEEERKRAAAYDPALRWQHIQQTITWIEANLAPHLRRNRPRTRGPLKPKQAASSGGGTIRDRRD